MLHVLDSHYHVPVETPRHRVSIDVVPALANRNRLTCAFRLPLAIPHLVLVGGPAALAVTVAWREGTGLAPSWGASTGLVGAVAAVPAHPAFGQASGLRRRYRKGYVERPFGQVLMPITL